MPTSIPFRVLHVINSLATGGAERLLYELAPRLMARGAQLEVLALDSRGDAFSAGLRARGVPVRFAAAGPASPYSPARALALLRAAAALKPQLVHAHLSPSLEWCALALGGPGRRPKPALVATEHAVANRRMASRLLTAVDRRAYRAYAAVACVSREAAEALRAWLGDAAPPLRVIPNGVDLAAFGAGATADPGLLAFKGGRFLIAMTARFIPEKDHETALRALALLPEGYALAFIGDGPTRPRIEALAKELGLGARVAFLGTRADLPAVLAATDAYLQSSYAEGFGIAALEAMAAGLPTVAADAGGLGPLVRGAGLLAAPGDAAGLARALALAAEPAERRRLGAACRARAAEHDIEATAEAYAELYAQARSGEALHGSL